MILKKRLIYIVITILATIAATGFILKKLDNSLLIIFPSGLTILGLIFYYFIPATLNKTAKSFFKYRWLCALVIFTTAVFLQLHGSSIGEFDKYFPQHIEKQNNILFGITRSIRSDEYGIQTPVFFSQQFNQYKLHSNMMSLSPTNMTLNYYSPVKNITALGKPMMWGYLFFGNAIGLSWYWCSMEILLFMLALEMFLIITEKKKLLSCTGAAMLLYSPAIQWWMMPHMPVVILYSMGLFSIGYHFFMTGNKWTRTVYGVLAVIAATGFTISIFPSFQVPCFYIITSLLCCTLYRDKAEIKFTHRDLYLILISAAVTIGITAYFIITSRDDI